LYFSDEDEEYGQEATIVSGYRIYCVGPSDDGPYINAKGTRCSYRPGYVVIIKGTENRFFCAAHHLTRDDCEPAHLCLVTSPAGAAARA
jgi:hypothetical protein